MNARFPLTPALSPRERENRSPSLSKTCDWIRRTNVRIAEMLRLLFPLPEGEGQGEGKRTAAHGKRLDIPAGTAVRFEPGETKTVKLVEIAGKKVIRGGNNLASGKVSIAGKKAALKKVKSKGFANESANLP